MIESISVKDLTGWDLFINDNYRGEGGEVSFISSGIYLTIGGSPLAIPFKSVVKFEWLGGGKDCFELAYYNIESNYTVLTARKVA